MFTKMYSNYKSKQAWLFLTLKTYLMFFLELCQRLCSVELLNTHEIIAISYISHNSNKRNPRSDPALFKKRKNLDPLKLT